MTISDRPVIPSLVPVTVDAYRDIHKGIRSQLFSVVGSAGRIDPSDDAARAGLAAHVHDLGRLLEQHAHHEDEFVQPVLEANHPDLAGRVTSDHGDFETRVAQLGALADSASSATADSRRLVHELYIELALFTSDYLAHQDYEERVLMPALESTLGVDGVLALHMAVVASIPPDEMAEALAIMIPAMNIDDRTEMLGGMKAEAPAEVFQGVWGLVGSVLEPADVAALARRLELD